MWKTAKKNQVCVLQIHHQIFAKCYIEHVRQTATGWKKESTGENNWKQCEIGQSKNIQKVPQLVKKKKRQEPMVTGIRACGGLFYMWTAGKEAQAWPQLPLWKTAQQLSRMYCSSTPKTVVMTSGKLFTVAISRHSATLLGRLRTCRSPNSMMSGGKRG